MIITDYGNKFEVYFEYNQWFKRNLKAVKSVPNYRYNPNKKLWTFPESSRNELLKLQETHRAKVVEPRMEQEQVIGEIQELGDLKVEIPLKEHVVLRPYQRQGVSRGLEFKRYINGDDMGLGKTIQSIATMVGINDSPFLVICPASLKENWKREIEKFSNLRPMILSNKIETTWHRYAELGMVDVFIVNYESLKKYFVKKMPTKKRYKSLEIEMYDTINIFKGIIIDEAHRAKNPSTIQTKLCLRICHKKEVRMLLTGTPVVNKPTDLYPLLAIMAQTAPFGGTFKAFKDRYYYNGQPSNLQELNYLLNKHCYFRREKKDVLKDLPDKQRQTLTCDITPTHRTEYVKAENEFVDYLRSYKNCTQSDVERKLRGEIMVKLGILRGISARGKLKAVKEFVDDVMDSGQKLILFCNLKEIVNALKDIYPDAGTVVGSDTMDQRQKHIDSFQKPDGIKLIICNIRAAGTGITLTASSRVAFVEFPWTYADCVQCEDRAYRIGQKNNVTITYFLGHKTVDERIYKLIQEKKQVANTISGAKDNTEESFINKLNTLFEI